MSRFQRPFVALAGLLLVTVAACSSGSSSGSSSSSSPAATPGSAVPGAGASSSMAMATSPAAQGSATASAQDEIVIDNFAYSPVSLTVNPGQVVTVANHDSTTHTLTATTGNAFNTGDIAPGATATFTAPTKPGSYPYICSIHQFMHGTLIVR
ncbi:cupredoxin domain-containing protein [Streptacidiphilus albus]|uniref:cupredoxin domain-containing protein n=1 Tax=Streptacidiphilus albus TaxID=105425 RepID=UPI0009DFDCB5|nr:cupredoxin domain-containing protein [Streptacidiphilus albus]